MKGLFIITERDKPKRKLPKDALRRVATPCHATLFAYIALEANAKPVPSRPKSTSKLSRLAPLSETTAQSVRGCQIEKRNDASCMHRPGCHLERTRAIPPRSHLGTIGLLSFRAAAQPVKASPNTTSFRAERVAYDQDSARQMTPLNHPHAMGKRSTHPWDGLKKRWGKPPWHTILTHRGARAGSQLVPLIIG
ncbi:hypothetical protein RIF29_02060 [Crotalaria pallida]|uniref:Uncharacterized protein n=1 Tax=Crotalaria pallida TaxID=3830 RepID=A0AAN9J0A0_CROPI